MDRVPAANGRPASSGALASTARRRPSANSVGQGRRALRDCNHEFVATVAAANRVGGKPLTNNATDRSNGFGTGQMSVLVVQRFQAIQIEHEHRKRRVVPSWLRAPS